MPIETPPGSNLEYTSRKAEEVAALARSIPGVAYTYTTIGGTTGAVDEGQVYVALQPKAERAHNQEEIASTKLRMAAIYEQQLGDFDRSGKVYREVLELDGTSIVALRGLERIYQAVQDWPDLVQILERQLDVVETERERVEVLLKIAQHQEEHFLKFDIAAQRYEQALEIFHAEERAYQGLERCYRRLKQWLDLINAYERHISEAAGTATKVELYSAIAQVYAEEVSDVDRAIDAYRNIVDLDDTNVPALEALSKLYEKQGDAAQAIESMTRVADLTSDGGQRVEMYYRIGKALEEKLGDRGQAQERFEMALDLDPAHLQSLSAAGVERIVKAVEPARTNYFAVYFIESGPGRFGPTPRSSRSAPTRCCASSLPSTSGSSPMARSTGRSSSSMPTSCASRRSTPRSGAAGYSSPTPTASRWSGWTGQRRRTGPTSSPGFTRNTPGVTSSTVKSCWPT